MIDTDNLKALLDLARDIDVATIKGGNSTIPYKNRHIRVDHCRTNT